MVLSYFPYVSAFSLADDGTLLIDTPLVALGLALAPFVFLALGLVSRHPRFATRVLQAMGLLIAVTVSFGYFDRVIGAAAGFGIGAAICLRPPALEGVMAWRLGAVAFTVLYTASLVLTITIAGVAAGGLLPLLMIGFADEYLYWRETRDRAASG